MKKFLAVPVVLAVAAFGVAGCGGSSHPKSVNQANASSSAQTDDTVKSDLFSLLNNDLSPSDAANLGVPYWQVSTCVHQNGNEYQCSVWKGSDTRTVQVTDDGTNISEQGVGQGE